MSESGHLILLCGKMGSGKSTFAQRIAQNHNILRISEDEWLSAHYPNDITAINDYLKYSKFVKTFVKSHVQSVLKLGVPVILDFPANTVQQRKWLLSIANEINSPCTLVYLDITDEVCLQRLELRREQQPSRATFDTPKVFNEVIRYFEEPSSDEGVCVTSAELFENEFVSKLFYV